MTSTQSVAPNIPTRQTEKTPHRQGGSRRVSWSWIALSSLGIVAFAAVPYFTASLRALADGDTGLAPHYAEQPAAVQAALYVHIACAALALALGPLQFSARFRERFRSAHRWIGRTYLAAIAIGGIASLVMAPFNSAGLVGLFGFGALGILWLYTGWRAYRAVRARDIRSHQAWMIRNFSLTYAAVTLRAWTGVLLIVQVPFAIGETEFGELFTNAYAAVPFLCWLPNIIVAEFMIRRRGLPALHIIDPARQRGADEFNTVPAA